ncbi:MAG: alpha-L-rhamnosidase, partial [Kiritimatiellae bacterium]|nr:alpha-L-rhamnosidase [Kiritimatiellia bacterium]
AHWLIAHALGLTFAEPGGRTVRFAPESVGLAWAEGALATPFGPVRVRIERQADGSVAGRVISAPAEVKVVGP